VYPVPYRRMTLLDLAILVAFVATGLALLRLRIAFADLPRFFTSFSTPPWRWSYAVLILRLSGLLELVIPCALTATLGVLVLRLLPPRPGLIRLSRQPGFVACATFLAVVVFSSMSILLTIWLRGTWRQATPRQVIGYLSIAIQLVVQLGGWSVVAAWFVQQLTRRYRAEASWIDRLGRALGIFWIVAAVILTDLLSATIIRI
jgi:hypothetical protein